MKTRIFNQTSIWPSKVNFIDTNNVVLGYDMFQCCCEHATWSVSRNKDGSDPILTDEIASNKDIKEIDLDGYCFDPEFCELNENISVGDENNTATFRLQPAFHLRNTNHDLYVILRNVSNGYYEHGFTFSGKPSNHGVL